MTVRDIIVTHLKRTGLSQEEFAARLGVSVSCVSTTLSREDGNGMKVSTLVRWLDVLGSQLVVDTLLNIEDDMILDLEPEAVDYDKYRMPRERRQEIRRKRYEQRKKV